MEKVVTVTPHQRADEKCPSSWKNTTTLSTNKNEHQHGCARELTE